MSIQREMTLQEWVYKLPPIHSARKELGSMQTTIAQQAERIAVLTQAYEGQISAHNKTLDDVAQQATLIEKCEKALAAFKRADSETDLVISLDGGNEALAAIDALGE